MLGGVISAAALALCVGRSGGADPFEWNLALALLGSAALLAQLGSSRDGHTVWQRRTVVCGMCIVGIALLQLVPIPTTLLRILSPARAAIAEAAAQVGATSGFATLTIAPAKTWLQASRLAGFLMAFVVSSALAGRTTGVPWLLVVPLVVLGGLEAVVGLLQQGTGVTPVIGTYLNKNHFAGLLEMVAPFGVVVGLALLLGRRSASWGRAIGGVTLLFAGVLMVAGILVSSSKGALASTAAAFLVVVALAMPARLSGRSRWLGLALSLVAVSVAFVLLPSYEVMQSFGDLQNDPSAEGRLPIALNTLSMIAAYPLFGVGAGAYYPGLLPFQTDGLKFGWVTAHNDYLQTFAELGLVGFALAVVIAVYVCRSAVRAALRGPTFERQALGLACCAALTAIAVHSLVDFNLYIPANALALSWIAGIAVAAARGTLPEQKSTRDSLLAKVGLRLLPVWSVVYASLWLLFLSYDQVSVSAESRFCAVGVCNPSVVLTQLQQQHGEVAAIPAPDLVRLLQRDPAGAYNWENLGESLERDERLDEARRAFEQAVELGPRIPYFLFRAGAFYLRTGETARAQVLMRSALEGNAEYTEGVFEQYAAHNIPFSESLATLPSAAAGQLLLARQVTLNDFDSARAVWAFLVERKWVDAKTTRNYVNRLVQSGRLVDASDAFARYRGCQRNCAIAQNGSFERPFEAVPLDWSFDERAGATTTVSDSVAVDGRRSAQVRFDGSTNLNGSVLRQQVVVPAGSYRLSVRIRSEGLSTDEGPYLMLESEGLRVSLTKASGTEDWHELSADFHATADVALASLQLRRDASLKFDNRINGTLWVDDVRITRLVDAAHVHGNSTPGKSE